jgi:hypothetical protein
MPNDDVGRDGEDEVTREVGDDDDDDDEAATAAVGGGLPTAEPVERRGTSTSALRSSAERMSTSDSASKSAQAVRSGPLSRALFPEEEEEDCGGASGGDRRSCDAMLQSAAEADEEATEGIADDDGGEGKGADAGAVGSPEAATRRGMLHLYE